MNDCALCYGSIDGPATVTELGLLCWICFIAALASGELVEALATGEPVENVTVN